MAHKFLLFVCLSLGFFKGFQTAEIAKDEKRILMDDNNYYTILAKLDALEKEVTALKAQNAHSHDSVAFMAELTTTITGTGQHIYFDNVKLNQGNAYNPHHGTFVPPVNGTYLFSITACSRSNHFIVLQVYVNNDVLGRVLSGDTSYDECSSKVLIAHLKAGDDVYVQHLRTQGDYLLAYSDYGYPLFAGVLIQTD